MEAFEAYTLYLALKRHFTPNSGYDYFKYNGKTNASKKALETRKDRYFFHKLSKKADPLYFLVANFIEYGHNIWIGDLVNDSKYDDAYNDWLKKKESISYIFSQELSQLDDDLDKNLKIEDGQYPHLLTLYLRKKICIETLILLNCVLTFLPKWQKEITDTSLWPDIYNTVLKYSRFVDYDFFKIKNIIKDRFL